MTVYVAALVLSLSKEREKSLPPGLDPQALK